MEDYRIEQIERDLGRWHGEAPSGAHLVIGEAIARALCEIARRLLEIQDVGLNVNVRPDK